MLLYTPLLVASFFIASAHATLPTGWTSMGCWLDNTGFRTLDAASFFDPSFNTQESCINFCIKRNYRFAGVEFQSECYCDNAINNNATVQATTDCSLTCPGNSAEQCGGVSRLNLFQNTGSKREL
ncbi:hypothetical protein M422DRAFT_23134 [Sphaerobolus stellatus SS14]|nr:hypothetical protein M422DRAFT_23134 [Sphaerobolus stellatus SS14]